MRNVCATLITLLLCSCVSKKSSDTLNETNSTQSSFSAGTGDSTGGGKECPQDYRNALKLTFYPKFLKSLTDLAVTAYSMDGTVKTSLAPSMDNPYEFTEKDELPEIEKKYYIEITASEIKPNVIEDVEIKLDECGKFVTQEFNIGFPKRLVPQKPPGASNTFQSSDDFIVEPLSAEETP